MSLVFGAPLFLWGLLALPLIVLLHFVRRRKRRHEVSALFLWRKAQELARARRRTSPSWLLIAQLTFATLAALALAQPSLRLQGTPDRVLVVDASASMAARDSDGVRLEKAVAAARELIGGGRVAVVRAGLDATVAQPLSADAGAARAALEALVAADREADLTRALELARSVAGEAGEVWLFSDQPPPSSLAAVDARYRGVAGDAVNTGIATFEVGIQQAYVAVVSTSARPQEVRLTLSQDGRPLAQTTLLVPSRGRANASFPLEGSGFIEARIDPPAGDALALDDVAVAGSRELQVLLDAPSPPLQRALAAIPGVEWRVLASAAERPADVRVLTGADPATLPNGRYLVFEAPSDDARFLNVRDFDQSDPLLRFVDLRDVVVGVSPDWAPDEEGWEVLARATDLTPLLLRRDTPEQRLLWAGFHPSQTDMVLRPAFPTLVANVLSSYRGEEVLPLGAPLQDATFGGEPVERALEPGIYRWTGRSVAASLLSAAESRLPGPPEAGVGDAADAPVAERTVSRSRGVALWLVAAALAALIAEWLLWARGGGAWLRAR